MVVRNRRADATRLWSSRRRLLQVRDCALEQVYSRVIRLAGMSPVRPPDEDPPSPKADARRLYSALSSAVIENIDYFRQGGQSNAGKFVSAFMLMAEHSEWMEPRMEAFRKVVHEFDFDQDHPGNGFRSCVTMVDRFVDVCIKLCRVVAAKRTSLFFRSDHYLKEVEAHVKVFSGLKHAVLFLEKMMRASQKGQLFAVDGEVTAAELLKEYGTMDQSGFYGRCCGFYFCESMRKTLLGVSIIMASFSDSYHSGGGPVTHAAASVLNGGKYILNPELRAEQVVKVAQNAPVDFVKAFFSLSETHLMKKVPGWLCPSLAVRQEIFVPAVPIVVTKADSSPVTIPVPMSHIPTAPVRCRLLSYVQREGQAIEGCSRGSIYGHKIFPPSPALLFHCHGGGFISHSPEAHEIYLRDWAQDLNVPILSVAYSLSPAAPFPRALEELLLAYVWCLENCRRLGSTGERICVAGDSAGGNLVVALTLKAIELGIRKPDAIYCAFTPLMLDVVPSPSRLLCAIDPLLPVGFMLNCLDAYARASPTEHNGESVQDNVDSRANGMEWRMGMQNQGTDLSLDFQPSGGGFSPETNPSAHFSNQASFTNPIKMDVRQQEQDHDILQPSGSPGQNEAASAAFVNDAFSFSDAEIKPGDDDIDFELPRDLSLTLQAKLCNMTRHCVEKLSHFVEHGSFYKTHIAGNPVFGFGNDAPGSPFPVPWYRSEQRTLSRRFEKLSLIARNPHISPLLASDDVLRHMPPVYFLSLHFDPTLDDSIMFSRRLRDLGCKVNLDILDKLPHGFLNFVPFSKRAHDSSRLWTQRMKEGLGVQT